MARQFVDELQPRENVDEVFRVADKQIRANRQGNDYLLLQLMDRTGQISGLRWNAGQSLYETFHKGDYLRVVGTTQLHNGMLQMILQDFEVVDPDDIDPSDYSRAAPGQIDDQLSELRGVLESVECQSLKSLVGSYLSDDDLIAKLRIAPAGIKAHHAYEGGLLKHIVDLLKIAEAIAPCYPQLDRDLLVVGVFLHDIGKLDELSYASEMAYTNPGQMLGHLVQGAVDLARRADALRGSGVDVSEEVVLRLQHMIVSHHGQLDHGSPKVPMTIEAIVLAYIDDLDAKVNAATELVESDRNSDSEWTGFNPTLGRKVFKPSVRS